MLGLASSRSLSWQFQTATPGNVHLPFPPLVSWKAGQSSSFWCQWDAVCWFLRLSFLGGLPFALSSPPRPTLDKLMHPGSSTKSSAATSPSFRWLAPLLAARPAPGRRVKASEPCVGALGWAVGTGSIRPPTPTRPHSCGSWRLSPTPGHLPCPPEARASSGGPGPFRLLLLPKTSLFQDLPLLAHFCFSWPGER